MRPNIERASIAVALLTLLVVAVVVINPALPCPCDACIGRGDY